MPKRPTTRADAEAGSEDVAGQAWGEVRQALTKARRARGQRCDQGSIRRTPIDPALETEQEKSERCHANAQLVSIRGRTRATMRGRTSQRHGELHAEGDGEIIPDRYGSDVPRR